MQAPPKCQCLHHHLDTYQMVPHIKIKKGEGQSSSITTQTPYTISQTPKP